MSSPLSVMTCLRVQNGNCWIRVEPMQALTLPYSDTFALATLLEPLAAIVRVGAEVYFSGQISGPLGAAIEEETGLGRVDVMLRLREQPAAMAALAARYVSFRGYRDVEGFTVPAGLRPDADGFYVATRWWESEQERGDAHRRVSEELEAWYDQYYVYEEEGGPPPVLTQPTATLVIEAARPQWLAHMVPGMTWDGYCYDDVAPSFP